MAANYYRIIRHLIHFKNEFSRIKQEKFKGLIDELNKYEIDPYSDNEQLPNHKTLAVTLNYNQTKMNGLIKNLLSELISSLSEPPVQIRKVIHRVYIHVPYDELHKLDKERVKDINQQSTWIDMVLPVTPGVGDEIEIPLIEETGKYYRGYVHEVRHSIIGYCQEIMIVVHPWKGYYHKWHKMKDEHERNEAWIASMRNT
jgi:hypothetical protein